MDNARWIPVARHVPGWFDFDGEVRTGEINGQPAWTDGSVMCLGSPPAFATVMGPKDFSRPLRNAERENLRELTPLAVAELGSYTVVVFSDGHAVQAKFYDLIHSLWPVARWFGDDESQNTEARPISIRQDGELVALVMAIKWDGCREEIASIIQSANGIKAQPAIPSSEERQQQKKKSR